MPMRSYEELLQTWCDGLLHWQITGLPDKQSNGAFYCPACKSIHGRCDNAVFPLLYMFSRSGEEKYRTSALQLMDWQENLLCDDGAVYNDGNNAWQAITVFSVSSYLKALTHFGPLLGDTAAVLEQRCRRMCDWLCRSLTTDYLSNINYQAANAAAMAAAWKYFGNEAYRARAAELLAYALQHFSENKLLYGEGHPHDLLTAKGCRAIDIGYNAEESLPALVEAACLLQDEAALQQLTEALTEQLAFMLPDGAWDNSFGGRNYKWTYWGSRTTAGCAATYFRMRDRHPAFAAAAAKSVELLAASTHDGLLYGGPQYRQAGERPCIHHTFCHAGDLASALLEGLTPEYSAPLPLAQPQTDLRFYPELATYRLSIGDWIADVTAYDFGQESFASGRAHATGGALSLLYSRQKGPVLVSSVYQYSLTEPLNQQLTLHTARHAPLTPRIDLTTDGRTYSSCLDTTASLRAERAAGEIVVCADGSLRDIAGRNSGVPYHLDYRFSPQSVTVTAKIAPSAAGEAAFVLPVVRNTAGLQTPAAVTRREIFHLIPGFTADEYRLEFTDGALTFTLTL